MPDLDRAAFVETRVDRVLTQYRESARLLALMRHGLEQRADAAAAVLDLPEHFNLLTARGDQLTIIGKWLGFPRCHCVCVSPPVIGFAFPPGEGDPNVEIVGLCEEGVFDGCFAGGTGDVCISDDRTYRRYLLARRYQMLGRYALEDLEAACRLIWGPATIVLSHKTGAVCAVPGRVLSATERAQLPVAFKALPVAPGIATYVHHGDRPLIGFGEGWHGFCGEADLLCPVRVDPYFCS